MRTPLMVLAAASLAACQTYPTLSRTLGPAGVAAAQHARQQQLLEADRRLANAAQAQGLNGALAGAVDPTDGFVVRPGILYVSGELENGYGASSAGPIYWQPDRVFVSAADDMGVTSGRYVQVQPGSQAFQGRYVVVWRKDPAGEWRALTETRTPDPSVGDPARLARN